MNNNESKVLLTLCNRTILIMAECNLMLVSTVLVEKEKERSELNISFILFDNSSTIGHSIFKTTKNIDLTVSDYNITYPTTDKLYGLGIEVENSVNSVINNSPIMNPLRYEQGYIRSKSNHHIIDQGIRAEVRDEFKDQMNEYLNKIVEKLNASLFASLSVNPAKSTDIDEIIEQMKEV